MLLKFRAGSAEPVPSRSAAAVVDTFRSNRGTPRAGLQAESSSGERTHTFASLLMPRTAVYLRRLERQLRAVKNAIVPNRNREAEFRLLCELKRTSPAKFFQGVLVFGGFKKGEKRSDEILRSDAIKPPKHPIAAALAVSVK